jgi:hypothetical protein
MLETLERLRIVLGARPLLFTLAFLALFLVAGRFKAPGPIASGSRFTPRAIGIAGVAALVIYAATLTWYALDPHFYDNAEPSVVAIGWLFHAGQPVYHLPAAPERYTHIYGPLAFMLHGYALGAFGPGLLVSKITSAAAASIGLALTFVAVRRHTTTRRAMVIAGLGALLLLGFKNFSYWTRPEPFQLLAVSASLVFATQGRGALAAIGAGLASGVLWNLKITGPLYSLPILVLLQQRAGWRACSIAVAIGIATAAFPFAVFDNISLENYLYWFRRSAQTGLLLSTLKQNLEWALYLCVPLLLAYFTKPAIVGRSLNDGGLVHRSLGEGGAIRPTGVLVAAMTLLSVAAAKPGAGPYHLMAFLPTIAYLTVWQSAGFTGLAQADRSVKCAATAFTASAIAIALMEQSTFLLTMSERRVRDEAGDVERFARAHVGAIEMGYGATEAASLIRPLLVFRNNAYLIDQPAVREFQLEGLEIPAATLDAVAACRTRYWLIPKGEEPFSGRNGYAAVFLKPMYPDAFRTGFFATHTRTTSTEYYDVWECIGSPRPPQRQ